MKSSPHPTGGIKFAEAAVLFVLILGLTVFVGIKVVSHGEDQADAESGVPAVTTTEQPSPAAVGQADSVVVSTAAGTATNAEVAETTPTAPEPQPVPQTHQGEPVSYGEAEDAYTAGRYDEAVDLFSLYTEQNPGRAWGHYMLGMSLWKAGDPEGALGGFRTTLDLVPDHLKSLVNTGRVLLELGRPDEALRYLTKATDLAPGDIQARRVLARAQGDLGRTDAAEATYRGILADDPDDVWSLNNLGLLLIRQGRFPEALPALARAARLDENLACVQNNLGVALERTGYIAAAREAYARAVALDAGYAKAGSSLARLREVKEAEGLAPFDLAAVADSFFAGTATRQDEAAGILAANTATTPPTAAEAKPEHTAEKNR